MFANLKSSLYKSKEWIQRALTLPNNYKPLVRCLIGAVSAMLLSTLMGNNLPQLAAVISLIFLEKGKQPIPVKMSVIVLLALTVFGLIGLFIAHKLVAFPLVTISVLGIFLFLSFLLITIPQPVRMLFLIMSVLLPFLALKASVLSNAVLNILLLNMFVGLTIVHLSYLIFPQQQNEKKQHDKKLKRIYKNINTTRLATNGLIVLLPLIVLMYLYNSLDTVLILVFSLILGLDPFIYQSKKGLGFLMANVLGITTGVIAFFLLAVVPQLLFLVLVLISAGLFFVPKMFFSKHGSDVYRIGFNVFFVVIGVLSTSGSDTDVLANLFNRLLQITVAVLYINIAFRLINTVRNPRLSTIK